MPGKINDLKKQRNKHASRRSKEYRECIKIFNDVLMSHDYELKLRGKDLRFIITLTTDIPLEEATGLLDWERVKSAHISTAV